MRYLLDTNVFLWWLNKDQKLKPSIGKILSNPNNLVLSSVVSAWEISIKLRTNPRFKLKTSINKAFQASGFEVLNINLEHVIYIDKLPLIHKDPFDRMIVAQAKVENLYLISADEKVLQYDSSFLKA